jgi:alkylation response protein AidB-like acyl-CoA dehydrogenase
VRQIRGLCTKFPDEYWREHDDRAEFPQDFFDTIRAVQTLGGYGYIRDYDVERYFRECRLTKIAPVSQEMALNSICEHVLGLPAPIETSFRARRRQHQLPL